MGFFPAVSRIFVDLLLLQADDDEADDNEADDNDADESCVVHRHVLATRTEVDSLLRLELI
jgi:hypothetical protein